LEKGEEVMGGGREDEGMERLGGKYGGNGEEGKRGGGGGGEGERDEEGGRKRGGICGY